MEIFQTIWTALTAENELLIKLTGLPLCFIDTYVCMSLFTTIFRIHATKKSKLIYIFLLSICAFISRNFVPNPYGTFINMVLLPLFVITIFKTTIMKGILASILPYAISLILETLFFKIYHIIFGSSLEIVLSTPLYRISAALIVYLSIFILYKLAKHFNINIYMLDSLTKKSKILLMINAVLGIVSISSQFYLINFYIDIVPIYITLLSSITTLTYFTISIYSILNITKLEITSKNLEESKLYNKSLSILHDNIRGFKHDFDNIVQAIGGYIVNNDIDGLQRYYSQLLQDCQRVNNIAALSPSLINNPAIYSILSSKYYKANENGININLEVFIDFNELEKNIKIYEFTRILGILMDNAIEASSVCSDKKINLFIRTEHRNHRHVFIISNTYTNKDINTDKIYEKGFSTKEGNSGIGLWEVRQILKKNNNLNLYTTKDNIYFNQQLEIYY